MTDVSFAELILGGIAVSVFVLHELLRNWDDILSTPDITPKPTSSESTSGTEKSSMSRKNAFVRALWRLQEPKGWFVHWRMVGSILTPWSRLHWLLATRLIHPLWRLSGLVDLYLERWTFFVGLRAKGIDPSEILKCVKST